jgi:hypothetical protein
MKTYHFASPETPSDPIAAIQHAFEIDALRAGVLRWKLSFQCGLLFLHFMTGCWLQPSPDTL